MVLKTISPTLSFSPTYRRVIFCTCLALFAALFLGGTTLDAQLTNNDAQESKTNRDTNGNRSINDVDKWIRGLASDKYSVRIESMNRLVEIGPPSVGPLSKAIESGGTDLKIRGIRVLESIAENQDSSISAPAEEKLVILRQSQKLRLKDLAGNALNRVFLAKQKVAYEKSLELGAVTQSVNEQIGPTAKLFPVLIFGEKYKGTQDDIKSIRYLRATPALEFHGERFSDAFDESLPKHGKLISIAFKDAPISNRMVKSLQKLDSIQRVVIQYSKNVDMDCLPDLKSINGLVDLKLIGTGFKRTDLAQLEKALPNVTIDLRTGGFLGIQYLRGSAECTVSTVVPGEAAAKAGIKVGDTIIEYDGKKVTAPETLSPLLSEHEIGHEAPIKVKRGSETIELKVKLSKWK